MLISNVTMPEHCEVWVPVNDRALALQGQIYVLTPSRPLSLLRDAHGGEA
jgi:hypothetical protein